MKRSEAEAFVQAIVKLREASTDAQASMAAQLFPALKQGGALIAAGTRINWNGEVMRAAVDVWDAEGNDPDNAPTLWESIGYREGYRIIPETLTAGTAFAKDERGWWGEVLYISLIDSNVWTPDAYPSAWEKASE